MVNFGIIVLRSAGYGGTWPLIIRNLTLYWRKYAQVFVPDKTHLEVYNTLATHLDAQGRLNAVLNGGRSVRSHKLVDKWKQMRGCGVCARKLNFNMKPKQWLENCSGKTRAGIGSICGNRGALVMSAS